MRRAVIPMSLMSVLWIALAFSTGARDKGTVKSLNNLAGDVKLATAGGATIASNGIDTITITAGQPGGNSLDEAYDKGGPGGGRIITADAGPVVVGGPDGLLVSGHVGIGKTTPAAPLHIQGGQAFERLVSSNSGNGSVLELWNSEAPPGPFREDTLGAVNFGTGSATRGQIAYYRRGLSSASGLAFRAGGATWMEIHEDGTLNMSGTILSGPIEATASTGNTIAGETSGGYGIVGQSTGSGWGGLFQYGTDGNNAAYLGGNGTAAAFYGPVNVNGQATVSVLEITGGSDLSEPFAMSSQRIPEGSVVIIDSEHQGELALSDTEYDTRVAGVVSGANGIKPGISMRQDSALPGGQNVALSGRVYALADARYGAIHPGDLLTASNTPGRCMKVADHRRAEGAILGKAMSKLEQGPGMVLMLVSLQ